MARYESQTLALFAPIPLCAATLVVSVSDLDAAMLAPIAQQAYLKASNTGANDFSAGRWRCRATR